VAGTGREEQGKVFGEEWEGRIGVRARTCIQTHHWKRLHFQFKMYQKCLAAGLRPDPLVELEPPP